MFLRSLSSIKDRFILQMTNVKKFFLSSTGATINPIEPTKEQYPYSLTADEKVYLQRLITDNKNTPMVVVLYDKRSGTTFTDLTIDYLKKKGITIVQVSPFVGAKHTIFSSDNIHSINGILLPGGPNVSDNPFEKRKEFEDQLIDFAAKNDIPLLGICRGHQTIGHHYGFKINDISYGHTSYIQGSEFNNTVKVQPNTQLYLALNDKLKKSDLSQPIEYNVSCYHRQRIKSAKNCNANVTISARDSDYKTIESIEIKTGKYVTYGLQHHPENIIKHDNIKYREHLQSFNKANKIKENAEKIYLHLPCEDEYNDIRQAHINAVIAKENEIMKTEQSFIASRSELSFFTHQIKRKFLDHDAFDTLRLHDKSWLSVK